MLIKEFTLSCDKCGTVYGTADSEADLVDMVDEALISNYWEEAGGKYLCPKCNGNYDPLDDAVETD
jgi:hypothetical protein